MTLTAPPHLRGRMTNRPPELMAERNAWILEAWKSHRHTNRQIADALGLNLSAIGHVIAQNRTVRDPRPGHSLWASISQTGLVLGSSSKAFDAMPEDARLAISLEAARRDLPVLMVMADRAARHCMEARA